MNHEAMNYIIEQRTRKFLNKIGQIHSKIGGEQGSSDLIPAKVMFQPADTPALSAADHPKKSAHDILMMSFLFFVHCSFHCGSPSLTTSPQAIFDAESV